MLHAKYIKVGQCFTELLKITLAQFFLRHGVYASSAPETILYKWYNIIYECQSMFNFKIPSEQLAQRKDNFIRSSCDVCSG